MTIFDLIFLTVFFSCMLLLIIAFIAAMDHHQTRLFRVLQQLGFLVGIYLSILIIVSIASPRKALNVGETYCSDDWCLAVEDVKKTYTDSLLSCTVTFRLTNRARRWTQRENGVGIYIIDDDGRRYKPDENPNTAPFNTILQPGQSVITRRKFRLPKTANNLGLILNRSKLPGMFIIGDEQSLFHKRTVIRLR